jgi:hypothetical protein
MAGALILRLTIIVSRFSRSEGPLKKKVISLQCREEGKITHSNNDLVHAGGLDKRDVLARLAAPLKAGLKPALSCGVDEERDASLGDDERHKCLVAWRI